MMPLRTVLQVNRRIAKPVYWQIKEAIRACIERGDLKPGEVLPGRLELCRMLGTNRPAVDRAIAELVKEGWLISIKGKGTFVAEALGQGKSKILTCAVIWFVPEAPQLEDATYWGPLMRGVTQGAAEREIRLLFRYCPPEEVVKFVRTFQVDGLIVLAPYLENESVLLRIRQQGIPFVALAAAFEDDSLPCVDVDNFTGVRLALEHLWGLGHRKIAIVDLALKGSDPFQRWEAFQRLMGDAGLSVDPRWSFLRPAYHLCNIEITAEWLTRWLSEIPLPTAIFAATYDMALATLQALRRLEIAVPQEMSLISFDDPPSAAFLNPPLTAVRQPVEDIGRRAVQKLYDALKKGVMPEGTELLTPELIVRDSTAPPRAEGTKPSNITKGGALL